MIILSLAALTLADHAPAPSYAPRPTYKEPKYENHPPAYEYSYTVQDDYAGVNFGQNEKRDGYVTSGQYHVALPDCRIQTVTYTVDAYAGYIADVSYSGEPCEPKYHAPKPTYHAKPAPRPVYKPAPKPAYKPAA